MGNSKKEQTLCAEVPKKQRPIVLIHPPAVSKRYLRTRFMPYGMAVLYAFLKDRALPVVQHDFLMEYLFHSPGDIDFHDPANSFTEGDLLGVLSGRGSHGKIQAFVEKYCEELPSDGVLYGFSIIAYHQFWAALLMGKNIRRVNPKAEIVFGGPFITVKPAAWVTAFGVADYWVKGSGEQPLLMLYALSEGNEQTDKAQIPGLVFFQDGCLVENPQSVMPACEESAPDFESLGLDKYRYNHPTCGPDTLFLPYRISKGCPSRCTFCTGCLVDPFSTKSVDKVIQELTCLAARYRTHHFMFTDACINASPVLLSELCRRLRRELPEMRWYAYARVRGFGRKLLIEASQAGCFSLFWGVESSHQPTVDLLGKGFSVDRLDMLIEQATRLGIKSNIHLMYNTPHETDEDLKNLIGLLRRFWDNLLVTFMPQRFLLERSSLLFINPEDYGLGKIRKVETGLFEREQFIHEEKTSEGGIVKALGVEDVAARNERNRQVLAPYLEWIRCRDILIGQGAGVAHRLAVKLLLHTGEFARQRKLFAKLHGRFTAWIERNRSAPRELM